MHIDFHRHLEGSHSARALLVVAKQFHLVDPLFLAGGSASEATYVSETALAAKLGMQGPPGDAGAFYASIETARRAYVSSDAIAALSYETFIDAAAEADAVDMRVSLFSMTRTLLGRDWRNVAPVAFAEKAREVLLGVLGARDRAEQATHKRFLVRLGLSRTFESEPHYQALAAVVAEHASALCGLDVLGIIAGPDKEPLQPGLVAIIEQLRSALPDLTVHAGEFEGAASVDNALKLDPRGIGHGVRSLSSDDTLQRLRDQGVTLEVCPSSNALLIPSEVAALRASHGGRHPLCALQQGGVFAVLGSDDPIPMSTSFTRERSIATQEGVDQSLLDAASARRWQQLVS